MGWLFFHKPKGEKVLTTMRNRFGEEWWTKNVVAASASFEAVFIVAKFSDPNNKVWVPDADGTVRAILVYKIQNVPRAADGYNFGYKDMSEEMGPYGCECPPSIIAAASPLLPKDDTNSSLMSAHNYRERSLAMSKAKAAKKALKVGARVKLAKPLSFGGVMLDEFVVDRCRVRGRKGMSTVFRSTANGGLYSLSASNLQGAVVT